MVPFPPGCQQDILGCTWKGISCVIWPALTISCVSSSAHLLQWSTNAHCLLQPAAIPTASRSSQINPPFGFAFLHTYMYCQIHSFFRPQKIHYSITRVLDPLGPRRSSRVTQTHASKQQTHYDSHLVSVRWGKNVTNQRAHKGILGVGYEYPTKRIYLVAGNYHNTTKICPFLF